MTTAAERYLTTTLPDLHFNRSPWQMDDDFIPAFKALSACLPRDPDSRLHAVSIEITGGGLAYLSATNGHLLLTLEVMLPSAPEGTTRTAFTGNSVKKFVTTKGYSPLEVCEFPDDFPPVRNVIPKEFGEAHNRIGISANYIDTLTKVLKAFRLISKTKMTPVTMQHNGVLSPMLFSFESDSNPVVAGTLTVMPMRLD
jgi:hypothetical protein